MDAKRFSRWALWDDRNELKSLKCPGVPGVYTIAISKHDLSGKRFSWIKEIKYVGMSNAVSGLRGRLKQFDNTIIGKTGHGGALRFLYDYPRHEKLVPLLYVAIAPFKCKITNAPTSSDLLVMGDVVKA